MTLKKKEVREMDPVDAYQQGCDDYYAGLVPKGWDRPDAYENPYLAGWLHQGDMENGQNFFGGE